MALDFTNATLLGYNVQNEFLGDNLNHRKIISMTIQGLMDDGKKAGNTQGVAEIYSKINKEIAAGKDYWEENIIVNGKNFGLGKVTSLSFDSAHGLETDQIRYGGYSVSLEIPQEGDYLKDEYLEDYRQTPNALAAIGGKYINGWEESLDIKKESDGTTTASLSLSIDLMSGALAYSPASADAKISKPLYNIKKAVSLSLGSSEGSILYDILNPFYSTNDYTIEDGGSAGNWTENYDLINFNADISKSFKVLPEGNTPYTAGQTAGFAYTAKTSRTLSKNQDGVITVSENGEVQSLGGDWHNMTGGLQYVLDGDPAVETNFENGALGAYARCLVTYNDLLTIGDGGGFSTSAEAETLYNQPLSIGRQYESGAGRGSYNVSFSDKSGFCPGCDPNDGKEQGGFLHEYTQSLSRDARGIISVSENGTITAQGQKTATWSGPAGMNYYEMAEGHLAEFAGNYNSWDPLHAVPVISMISESIKMPRYGKQVTYKRVYTSDPSVLPDGHASKLKKYGFSISDTAPIPMSQDFLIPHRGNKGEVVHQPGQTEVGARTINVEGQFERLCGYSSLTGNVDNALIDYWTALVFLRDNVLLPEAYLSPSQLIGIQDMYIKDASYSIKSDGKINLTANLEYTAARINPGGSWTDNNSNYNA